MVRFGVLGGMPTLLLTRGAGRGRIWLYSGLCNVY